MKENKRKKIQDKYRGRKLLSGSRCSLVAVIQKFFSKTLKPDAAFVMFRGTLHPKIRNSISISKFTIISYESRLKYNFDLLYA